MKKILALLFLAYVTVALAGCDKYKMTQLEFHVIDDKTQLPIPNVIMETNIFHTEYSGVRLSMNGRNHLRIQPTNKASPNFHIKEIIPLVPLINNHR